MKKYATVFGYKLNLVLALCGREAASETLAKMAKPFYRSLWLRGLTAAGCKIKYRG